MRHVGFAHRPLEEALKVGPGEVEFDGDCFVFDQRSDSAEKIETFVERGTYCRAVRFAYRYPDVQTGGSVRSFANRACGNFRGLPVRLGSAPQDRAVCVSEYAATVAQPLRWRGLHWGASLYRRRHRGRGRRDDQRSGHYWPQL